MNVLVTVFSVLISIALAVLPEVASAKTLKKGSEKKAAKDTAGEIIELTNVMVGTTKVWQPSELKMQAGKKYEVFLKNTLSDPHGFEVPGLTPPMVVKGNETISLVVTPEKAGKYDFRCQLHPAHVGGTVNVQ